MWVRSLQSQRWVSFYYALAYRYTTEYLKFGKLDVSRWPAVGQQHKINVGGLSA